MALRSGYYGLKTKILNKVNKWDQIVFPRDEQAVLGAKNLLKNDLASQTLHACVITVNDDKTVSFANAPNNDLWLTVNNNIRLSAGKYILNGCPNGGGVTKYFLRFVVRDAGDTANEETYYDYGTGTEFEITSTTAGRKCVCSIYIKSRQSTGFTYKPMLSYDGGEYVPYAMTNRELTSSAADQKTAINAIITAATGAADFAAFKTAMGAITPVTRSLNRTASPEDVPEEVIEEEKPVTKKTTKKTVKEGD